ncbi:SpoIID/LytB domain-containing protein [Sporomusa acidovorans]|uniref:Sporulation stage II protein D amidase enhancer LytB N-terminal domain-containing protein n=1 Tax=Sporomusa acidovorans (strain ATCC 49682 / DSM 3132 / Mol) TaxID=1123286 RepID=A0ABZ3IW71_SPOA4|nr:SpoIID/LytB domain-containing protein [Sporomusa acidovorans]OZC23625.1 amidase enhancer precursor [Sporomusa acidovorans DSM 3132]SDE22875.1 stage II sporulation protein D [Sporomusa acidovorans]
MKNKTLNTALVVGIIAAFVTGVYTLLKPPAQKPTPAPAPAPMEQVPAPAPAPQPIAGVPQFDAAKYPNEPQIRVYLADKGTVETMPLEKYIEGVIAQEMEANWPMEALAAQAIASRTLTMSAIETGTIKKLHNADVSTSKEELQAFAPQKVNESVRQAVLKTRGEVLLYAGGLVNAIYSSCNGQIGATKEESFPKEIPHDTPYFQTTKDNCFTYAPEDIKFWTVKIPASQVAAAVGYDGDPADIRIVEKGPSGRILFIGADNKKIYGSDFRRAIGYDRLKSTLITDMTYEDGNFIFKGQGWGNGVGLCQWGAYTFAKEGKVAEDIICFYYPGAEVKKLWP